MPNIAINDATEAYTVKVNAQGAMSVSVEGTAKVLAESATVGSTEEDSVEIGNTAVDLVDANSARMGLEIWNHDTTHSVHLTLSSGTPSATSPKIGPGGFWSMPDNANYRGVVRAVCPTVSGTNTITIVFREYRA